MGEIDNFKEGRKRNPSTDLIYQLNQIIESYGNGGVSPQELIAKLEEIKRHPDSDAVVRAKVNHIIGIYKKIADKKKSGK